MTTAELSAAFAAAGAAAWGGLPFSALAPCMTPEARAKAEALCPHAATVLVAAFPYFTGETEGNLSVYARGADYHGVLRLRLQPICDFLLQEYPLYSFCSGADTSPLPEREAAFRAGLGVRGRNGLLILPPFGSYVFLGTILTDRALPLPAAVPAPHCMDCGRCVSVCPTGALLRPHREGCLSALSQKKGTLTAEEEGLLRRHPYIWGCDLCQNVCPYNQAPTAAPLAEFGTDCITDLHPEDLAGLTNRAFASRYGNRAFAWRGPAVLRRNLALRQAPPPVYDE